MSIEIRKVRIMGFSESGIDEVLATVQTAIEDDLGIAVVQDGKPAKDSLFEIELTVARKPADQP